MIGKYFGSETLKHVKGQVPEHHVAEELVLNQDDFIEWILKNTNDGKAVFRVHNHKNYLLVGIDKDPWIDPELDKLSTL